jgi:hypothetical protein
MSAFLLFGLKWLLAPAVPFYYLYAWLLRHTVLSGDIAAACILAGASTLLVLTVRSAWRERQRQKLFDIPPSRWRDGDAVALAARLRAGERPLLAPASGRECGLVRWKATRRPRRQRNNAQRPSIGNGLVIADAIVDTAHGPIELKGLPDLERTQDASFDNPLVLSAFARRVLHEQVDILDVGSIGEVLGGRAKFRTALAKICDAGRNQEGRIQHGLMRPSFDPFAADPLPWHEVRALRDAGDVDGAATCLANGLIEVRAEVDEALLPVGADVCIYGTWVAAERRVAVGPTFRSGRRHAIVGDDLPTHRDRGRRRSRGWMAFGLATMLIVHAIAVAALAPSFSSTPWRAGVVALPQLLQAWRGQSDALRPLLGSNSRPDAINARLDAERDAAYAETVRRVGATLPIPRPQIAPEADRVRAMRYLLRHPIDLEQPDGVGRLLLRDSRGDVMLELLRHGADPSGHTDGWTALHDAASQVDPDRVAMLLAHGADPSLRESYGRTPLEYARQYEPHLIDELRPISARVVALLEAAEATHPSSPTR